MRSLYLKEGLLLLHGSGLGMKCLTGTRKPYVANYATHGSTEETQTPMK